MYLFLHHHIKFCREMSNATQVSLLPYHRIAELRLRSVKLRTQDVVQRLATNCSFIPAGVAVASDFFS